ncbi:MAG TPA: UDP-3-O-(3-hydroxymyristoyl)glucosamine N-acyltransferase [Polyangiaceae bacterium]
MNGVRLAQAFTLRELVARFGGVLDPSLGDRQVDRVLSAASLAGRPAPSSSGRALVLWTSPRHVLPALPEDASCLCSPPLAERAAATPRWVHTHALWVVSELLAGAPGDREFRGSLAEPEPAGRIAADVIIEPGAVIHEQACIGAGSRIGPNAVIYAGVEIGRRVDIGAGAVIGRAGFGFTESPNRELVRVPHLGGVVIEDDVEVGALCTVDAGVLSATRLGRGVKLDAHVHVAHNVEIGAHARVAAQSGFAGSVVLEARVLVGGQSGVADHVRVGEGAELAAKSGVIGDIPAGLTVAGFPAVPRQHWLRAMASLLRRDRTSRSRRRS